MIWYDMILIEKFLLLESLTNQMSESVCRSDFIHFKTSIRYWEIPCYNFRQIKILYGFQVSNLETNATLIQLHI